jgi:integrative and conjugative element protein (TIGR02256 family)
MTHGVLVESIRLSLSASTFMTTNSGEHAPRETGGLLIGYVVGATLHIVEASPPGPHAEHRPTAFTRDGAFSQRLLDARVSASDGVNDYVGEWHSHPFAMGPSAKDVASMRRISVRSSYQCPSPVMLLCRRSRRTWRIEAYQWDGSRLAPRPLVLVDDVGPSGAKPSVL